MMAAGTDRTHPKLRAPREDGQTLIVPSWGDVGRLLAENEAQRAGVDFASYDLQGRTLGDVSAAAHSEMVKRALCYTRSYRDVPASDAARIVLAGHQPQLFHPGVWFKNFVLANLAAEHQAVAVNLLIDSDRVKETALRVPGGTVAAPVVEHVPYDAAGPPTPYEERPVLDAQVLAALAGRAAEHLRPFVPNPLLIPFWPKVVERAAATGNLGLSLAQARHQLEGEWGIASLELPFSQVCESEPFYQFLAHLLAHLPRLWTIYNESLAQYRRLHRLRSATHPVPDLSSQDGWLEAPFWLWTRDNPRRRPVFARQSGKQLRLSDRGGCEMMLNLSPDSDAAAAVQVLADLPRGGIKLRTRALTTTLWARLALGDLFLHGIGGAIYDELTDVLIRRFFRLRPPAFLTLTATLRLPIDRPAITVEELRQVERTLRDLTFRPDAHIDLADVERAQRDAVAARIAEKRAWIGTPQTPANAAARFRSIRRANEDLQPYVAKRREELLRRRSELAARLRADAILGSREYAFCLYPEEKLRTLLLAKPRDSA
jgi:hypothetical protein